MQWQKVQNIMSQASCALRGQPWSQKPVLEKHWESWFAVDIIFGRNGNNSKLATKLRHLSASRDPGVKTAETNRIVEQVLLNLKTLLLSLFVFLSSLHLVVHWCHKFNQSIRTMLDNLGDLFRT